MNVYSNNPVPNTSLDKSQLYSLILHKDHGKMKSYRIDPSQVNLLFHCFVVFQGYHYRKIKFRIYKALIKWVSVQPFVLRLCSFS